MIRRGLRVLFLVLGVFPLLASSGASQELAEPPYRRALYMEFGGNSLIYSINYDHAFSDRYTGRVGMGFFSDHRDFLAIPTFMGNYLLGQGYKRLELGAGIVAFTGDVYDFDTEVGATFSFAYRYHRPNDVFFKVGFTPIVVSDTFLPWFGISVGYSF